MRAEVVDLAKRALEMKARLRTPEQAERRRMVDERNAALQAGPIVRGPNAPVDGAFGGVRKS